MIDTNESIRRVAIFGATGKMGKLFVQQALNAGHYVRALVRNPSKLEPQDHPRIEAVVGDATEPEDVIKVVADVDVVVSCLGNVGRHLIMHQSFDNILSAVVAQATVPRCLFITSIGCGGTSWLVKTLLILIGGRVPFQDYEKADRRVLDESVVPCVLVRPYSLSDNPGSGRYRAREKQNGTFMRPIPRADVARFLVDALVDKQWDGKPGIQLGGRN